MDFRWMSKMHTTNIQKDLNFEYSDCKVDVVGNYNLKNGRVENVDNATFKSYKRWDPLNRNLLQGYNGYTDTFARQEGHSALEELLEWTRIHQYSLVDNEINFVCKRGILRRIGYTVNCKWDCWSFKVCCYNGIVYLSDNLVHDDGTTENLQKCYHSGDAFEEMLTSGQADWKSYLVAKCQLKDTNCLIAGEVDCKDSDEYVEIKTVKDTKICAAISKGWLQAYLIGNHKLVYGLRDSTFSLVNVIEEPIECVPHKYEEKGKWDGRKMLGFIYSVLQRIKNEVPEGGTYTLKYEGGDNYNLLADKENETFLSDEFKRYASSRQHGQHINLNKCTY